MGYLKSVGTSIIWIYTVLLAITFWPGLYPYAEFAEYSFNLPKSSLTGNLAINDRLNDAEILFGEQLLGPEKLAVFNGEVYTGLATGEIVKITKDKKLVPVFKIGEYDETRKVYKTGRPLGLKFDKNGQLFVADPHFGILKIDVQSKKSYLVVDIKKPIDGKTSAVPDDLDVASNGDIYWSDINSEVAFDGAFHPMFLANPSGRLIRYNAATQKNEVLISNLSFANGVCLSPDESFVLVAEFLSSRLVKYHLRGPKAGTHEVVLDSLSGTPDNIVPDGQGGFLLSLWPGSDSESGLVFAQNLAPHPYIRRMLARTCALLVAPVRLLSTFYPEYESFVHGMNAYFDNYVTATKTNVGTVLRLDAQGSRIVEAAYFSDGSYHPSSAHVIGDELWLGSYFASGIRRTKLSKAFPAAKAQKN